MENIPSGLFWHPNSSKYQVQFIIIRQSDSVDGIPIGDYVFELFQHFVLVW